MNREYLYEVKGKDGRGQHLYIEGTVNCEYSEVWDKTNKEATNIILKEGATCPITIDQVTITRIH